MSSDCLLAIDQGTTSSRAILFSKDGQLLASAQEELSQHYPKPGWVEHNPEDIWKHTLQTMSEVLEKGTPKAIGIANQRETIVVWNRETSQPIYPAVVWQDRRTSKYCEESKGEHEAWIQSKTGLLFDPYFSASKIRWILQHVPEAQQQAEAGKLAVGTVDTFLLWRLTHGKVHATDATNASRTQLFDLKAQDWCEDLLSFFGIPRCMLPEVRDSADDFGNIGKGLPGEGLPVTAILGDQQAALFGQACFQEGQVKSTYGTGCFLLMHTGSQVVLSKNRLLTTVACRLRGKPTFAIEGSIFNAGTAVQWLRDQAGMISHAKSTETLARQADDAQEVHFIPAFTGLGAPWWSADTRGAILGLSRNTGVAEIVRAALDAVCFQTRDLLEASQADGAPLPQSLRADGGMMKNQWLAQRLADLLGVPVDLPQTTEATAKGVAQLAGLHQGLTQGFSEFEAQWVLKKRYLPAMNQEERDSRHHSWQRAVNQVKA